MSTPVFKSTRHPGGQPWTLVYARAVVPPLAACMLPVMIVTLVALLEGFRVLPYFLAAFLAALGLSSLWTHFHMRRIPVEIRVREHAAAVRTLWEVIRGTPPEWAPVFDLRDTRDQRTVTVGYVSYDLDKSEWPTLDDLTRALQAARDRTLGRLPHDPHHAEALPS